MPTHSILRRIEYLREETTQTSKITKQTIVAGAEQNLDESFTDATEALVAYTLDVSQLKAFAIWSEGGGMVVETNSSSVPVDTFNLVDGVPQIYSIGQAPATSSPLTADVTALYVTNTGTAVLKVRALYDPTV